MGMNDIEHPSRTDVWREVLEEEAEHNRGVVRLQLQHARFKMALEAIAANSCCDKCQEAALVAKAALGV